MISKWNLGYVNKFWIKKNLSKVFLSYFFDSLLLIDNKTKTTTYHQQQRTKFPLRLQPNQPRSPKTPKTNMSRNEQRRTLPLQNSKPHRIQNQHPLQLQIHPPPIQLWQTKIPRSLEIHKRKRWNNSKMDHVLAAKTWNIKLAKVNYCVDEE